MRISSNNLLTCLAIHHLHKPDDWMVFSSFRWLISSLLTFKFHFKIWSWTRRRTPFLLLSRAHISAHHFRFTIINSWQYSHNKRENLFTEFSLSLAAVKSRDVFEGESHEIMIYDFNILLKFASDFQGWQGQCGKTFQIKHKCDRVQATPRQWVRQSSCNENINIVFSVDY